MMEYKGVELTEVTFGVERIREEYIRARKHYQKFNNMHDAYGIISDQADQLWHSISAGNVKDAKREAAQIGAMALALILEIEG